MADIFQFKQFSILQDSKGLKVGTDGVLIGAWATANKYNRILDIGTGTGLIALMAAQRFPEAFIEAVEINEEACLTAHHNFEQSNWSDRLLLHPTRIQDFSTDEYYNLIISNPPYFENSLKSGEEAKDLAKHTHQLAFIELILSANNLLKEGGTFAVILPADVQEKFVRLAKAQGLYCNRICFVYPTPEKPAKRIMMCFNKFSENLITEHLVIESNGRHQYSEEYIHLTKDFYLKM